MARSWRNAPTLTSSLPLAPHICVFVVKVDTPLPQFHQLYLMWCKSFFSIWATLWSWVIQSKRGIPYVTALLRGSMQAVSCQIDFNSFQTREGRPCIGLDFSPIGGRGFQFSLQKLGVLDESERYSKLIGNMSQRQLDNNQQSNQYNDRPNFCQFGILCLFNPLKEQVKVSFYKIC